MDRVRFEFPLGEVTTLGLMIALGIAPTPEIDPRGITKKDRCNAQGLEGKAFVMVPLALAQALAKRLGKYRCSIVS